MAWNFSQSLTIEERYKALVWNYSDAEMIAMRGKEDKLIDLDKINIWTVLTLRNRESYRWCWLPVSYKLWWKKVIVTDIDYKNQNKKYKIDWFDQNVKSEDIIKWMYINDSHIKDIIKLVPYKDIGKWFYEYKGKTYFNPIISENSSFNEDKFLNDSKVVDIIDDNTVEIGKQKFKKKHIWLK